MSNFISWWDEFRDTHFYHWLMADDVYLARYENDPDELLLQVKAGKQRKKIFSCYAICVCSLFASALLQVVRMLFMQMDDLVYFLLQALFLTVGSLLVLGALYFAKSPSHRSIAAFIVIWMIMLLLIFGAQVNIGLLFTDDVISFVIYGAATGCLISALILGYISHVHR